jgi:glycosyltransferase involved in cell wall biosynthesis
VRHNSVMRVLVFTEARLLQSEGEFCSPDQSFSYQMLKRYLKVFDKVLVLARASATTAVVGKETVRVEGKGVEVLPLPYYLGPYQYLMRKRKIQAIIKRHLDSYPEAAVVCRVPGAIGTAAAGYLRRKNRRYGVEVVGDPSDVFAPKAFQHPFRAFLRYYGVKSLKNVVRGAAASLYVTKKSLQLRYPPAENSFSTFASNVMLPPAAFVEQAKSLKTDPPYSIVSVGTMAAMYKSPDVAIGAVALLRRQGMRITFQWVGDGRYRVEMIDLAKRTGVADIISFVGNVRTASEVRSYLDGADLFVLPSRQEGLPRALVEAMARGLPCIGTAIGGMPELLDKIALVPINNPKLLADKIASFLSKPQIADEQAKRNLKEARRYAYEILDARRTAFYQYLKGTS